MLTNLDTSSAAAFMKSIKGLHRLSPPRPTCAPYVPRSGRQSFLQGSVEMLSD